jgi:hypothetical protein
VLEARVGIVDLAQVQSDLTRTHVS